MFTGLSAICLIVCVTGFEPTTFWSVAKSSNQYLCDLQIHKVTFLLHWLPKRFFISSILISFTLHHFGTLYKFKCYIHVSVH